MSEKLGHDCKCVSKKGSIHGKCNVCKGRLPTIIKSQPERKERGWTGSKIRSSRYN